MIDRELMQRSLNALDTARPACFADNTLEAIDNAITALRDRLAQPEPEPVAWMHPDWQTYTRAPAVSITPKEGWHPLYTAPRQWQGLTDEELDQAMDYWSDPSRSAYGGADRANGEYVDMKDTWRYIEAKLKEKNA